MQTIHGHAMAKYWSISQLATTGSLIRFGLYARRRAWRRNRKLHRNSQLSISMPAHPRHELAERLELDCSSLPLLATIASRARVHHARHAPLLSCQSSHSSKLFDCSCRPWAWPGARARSRSRGRRQQRVTYSTRTDARRAVTYVSRDHLCAP